ncbi:MAG: sigma-70 family RNA polymerase sigma factor [Planctomycetes bacterium]|nr:sigma-70 family RNA polymerase sigma factor [Planctomycetota bacterium]
MSDDRGSTSNVYELYARQVYGWAYRFLGRHHDALDVVQDVFLKWMTQCARGTPDHPRGWLRRVTVNRAIDVARQRRETPEADIQVVDRDGGEQALVRDDREVLREDVSTAMQRLPEMQRAVLVAKVYDELTFAQVADELDIAVSTAKTHFLRALTAMRERLRVRWAEDEDQ